jgi:hypothetical protein
MAELTGSGACRSCELCRWHEVSDRGGLTVEQWARREKVRLEAAEMFEAGAGAPEGGPAVPGQPGPTRDLITVSEECFAWVQSCLLARWSLLSAVNA